MKRKILIFLIVFFLMLLYIFLLSFDYVQSVSNNLSDNIFRLHIIANSDSYEDQTLKLKIKDKIVKYMDSIINTSDDKNTIISIVNSHIDDLKKIAYDTIYENGFNYTINISIGNSYFPTKNYGDISLPCGYYDALKIEIGNSSGKNWWCVLFPPLCFISPSDGIVPDDSKNCLKENISSEDYALISNTQNTELSSSEIKIKFKIVEILNNLQK